MSAIGGKGDTILTAEAPRSLGLKTKYGRQDHVLSGTKPRSIWSRISLRSSIGRRLLLMIILFSSLVTLIATLLQLYLDYHRDVSTINNRLDEIESSYLGSIAAGLWNLDTDQLNLQLDGIMALPDIQAVAITESEASLANPLVLSRGEISEDLVIQRTYPILYGEGDSQKILGSLFVQVTLKEVIQRLVDKLVVILLSQGVKTFLVSLFILYIFYWLVTRHLTSLADYVQHFDLRRPVTLFTLNRDQTVKYDDELEKVVDAFNDMCSSLKHAYEELREVNAELEADIVARKRAEEEVKRLNTVLEQRVRQRTAALEAANQELASFSYSVSHDLRTPLRRIEGFRRMLVDLNKDQLNEQGKHYLDRIQAGTQDMQEMIDSFLMLAKTTQNELNIRPINLSNIASEIAAGLKERNSDRTAYINVAPSVIVDADKRLMKVLLTNLLENAWKYTRAEDDVIIEFGAIKNNKQTTYFVKDHGIGFDMACADRLFSPFVRMHSDDEVEGVGVGLATVQRIIARHGGRVWATAEPDRGATFYFTFWDQEVADVKEDNFIGRR